MEKYKFGWRDPRKMTPDKLAKEYISMELKVGRIPHSRVIDILRKGNEGSQCPH